MSAAEARQVAAARLVQRLPTRVRDTARSTQRRDTRRHSYKAAGYRCTAASLQTPLTREKDYECSMHTRLDRQDVDKGEDARQVVQTVRVRVCARVYMWV